MWADRPLVMAIFVLILWLSLFHLWFQTELEMDFNKGSESVNRKMIKAKEIVCA